MAAAESLTDASQVAIEIHETATPTREEVKAFREILGWANICPGYVEYQESGI
jgi:hydrogenase maturation factor